MPDGAATSSSPAVPHDAGTYSSEQLAEFLGTVNDADAADETCGTLTTQSSSDGATQETMTITGSSGELAVTAVRTAPNEVPAGARAQLQDLVDATFEAVG